MSIDMFFSRKKVNKLSVKRNKTSKKLITK